MLTLDYRDARPIYTQICDGIQEQILSGVMVSGDKLPSVRDLATQLTINPNTIQRSYRQLELDGWIVSVPGKGSFVSGIPLSLGENYNALWKQLDDIVAQLSAMGITREEIIRKIGQGGNQNA